MKKLSIILVTVFTILISTISVSADEVTNNDLTYQEKYEALVASITYVPDFKLINGVLTASEDYVIKAFGHSFDAEYNKVTGKYEIDLFKMYSLYYNIPVNTVDDTLHEFYWENIPFRFTISTVSTNENAFCDSGLFHDLPDYFVELLNSFKHPIILGFYNEETTSMGRTNIQCNLVTSEGVNKEFIYVRLNKAYSQKNYNMANTLAHEFGHAIIDDIILSLDTDYNSKIFISNNGIIESNLVQLTIQHHSDELSYGSIYGEISDYASTLLCEIPSEAFSQMYLSPETATAFNKFFVEEMLTWWETIN